LILNIAYHYGYCDRVVADAFSFGAAMGILSKLNTPPSNQSTTKLLAYQLDGKSEVVWLDSVNATAGEVRTKIADALQISPVARVCIESGKGSILEDMNSPLINQIGDLALSVDFFGFTTIHCYISIKSESEVAPTSNDSENRNTGSGINYIKSLIGLTNKVNYGQNLTLTCKNTKTDDDVRPLVVAPVEKFAAAAPAKSAVKELSSGSGSVQVRLQMWSNVSSLVSENGMSDVDHNGYGSSTSGSPNKSRVGEVLSNANKLLSKGFAESGSPIKNGDIVIIECDGKFMAVTRGWWMGWSSPVPRRSGAFKVGK
jgi:hypothetical protein